MSNSNSNFLREGTTFHQSIFSNFLTCNNKVRTIEEIAEIYKQALKIFVTNSKKYGFFNYNFMKDLRSFHKLFWMTYYEPLYNKYRILRHDNSSKPKTNRTIRINQIPFTEAMLIHIMAIVGERKGINLEIVDVPWSETYRALENNRIDIALHDKFIKKVQRPLLATRTHQRELLCSNSPLYRYDGYYAIEKKDVSEKNRQRIAIIGNSEQNEVCKKYEEWDDSKSSLYPVDDVFECFEAVLKRDVGACIVGGYEKDFFDDCLEHRNDNYIDMWPDTNQKDNWVTKNKKKRISHPVDVYFWTLERTQEETWEAITTIDLWNETQKILNDDALELNRMKDEILCRLNRQLDIAFFVEFERLWETLKKHKETLNKDKDKVLFQICSKMVRSEDSNAA